MKKKNFPLIFLLLILSSAVLYAAEPQPAVNLPSGEKVVSGSVTVDRSVANTLNVNVASQSAIVEWANFSVASGFAVNFNFNIVQPSLGSILNSVTGSAMSVINGAINSNGSVFLTNPNGIVFGTTASVNAASFIASTLKMDYDSFTNPVNGQYKFFKDGAGSFIKNAGRIAAQPGGYIALLSQAVDNSGTLAVSSIDAKVGHIVLASGEKMTVAMDDRSLISVAIDEGVKETIFGPDGVKIDSAIKNSGSILADGGKVTLTAKTLNKVFDYAINNTGVIQANNLVQHDGVVELVAEGAPILNTGTIEAGKVIVNATGTDLINLGKILSQPVADPTVLGNIQINAVYLQQDGKILSNGLVTIDADTLSTTQVIVVTPESLAQDPTGEATLPVAVIQGKEVRISFKKLGTADCPIRIVSPQAYLYRTEGDINLLESTGIGTSMWMRGPPEDSFSIVYSKDSNLYLEAQAGSISEAQGVAVFAINLSFIADQNIDIYGTLKGLSVILNSLNGNTILYSGSLIDASTNEAGATGGRVEVLGNHVSLVGTLINASGVAGGGTVLIGGDFHGANSNVQNATATYVGPDATIKADAIQSGNGGNVAVWADNTTRYYGNISARGGANSGDGGFVEVSGKHYLDFLGVVNTLAPAGKAGTLLLDPSDITISAGVDAGMTPPGTTSPFTGALATSTLNVTTLTDALALGNVLVDASAGAAAGTGNITVSTVITWSTAQTLELKAGNDVLVSAAFNADTAGAVIKLTAGHDVTVNGALNAHGAGSAITLSAGHNVNVNAALVATGAASVIELRAGNDGTGAGTVIFGGGGSANAPTTNIYYNPTSYANYVADKTAYSAFITGGIGALNTYMLLYVTGLSADKTYNGNTTASLTGTATITPAAGDIVTLGGSGSVTDFSSTNVHTEVLTLSGYSISGANASKYSLFQPSSLSASITQAPLMITANDKNKTYGTLITGAAGSTAFTSTALQNGESIGTVTIAYGTGAAATDPVGTDAAQVTASAATGGTFTASNYSITYNKGAIIVGTAPLTITANDKNKTYGTLITGAAGSTAFTSTALQNGETIGTVTIAYGTGAAATDPVGTDAAQVIASAATGGTFTASNYSITYNKGAIIVGTAPLTVTATGPTKPYGTALTAGISATNFTHSGEIAGEAVTSVTLTPDAAGLSAATPAGAAYVVTPSLATGSGGFLESNYAVTYVNYNGTVGAAKALTVTADVEMSQDTVSQLAAFEICRFPLPDLVDMTTYQVNTFTPQMGPAFVYFCRPPTSYDMAAFDTIMFDESDLQFLNGSIGPRS